MTLLKLDDGRSYVHEVIAGEDVFHLVTKSEPVRFDEIPKHVAHQLVDLICPDEQGED